MFYVQKFNVSCVVVQEAYNNFPSVFIVYESTS